MFREFRSLAIPSRKVPMRIFAAGCVAIMTVAVWALIKIGAVALIMAATLCCAWWFVFLEIWDSGGVTTEGELRDDRSKGSAFEDPTDSGLVNVNGLPVDKDGYDTLGNTYGFDSRGDSW